MGWKKRAEWRVRHDVRCLSHTPNGKRIASGSSDDGKVRLWAAIRVEHMWSRRRHCIAIGSLLRYLILYICGVMIPMSFEGLW